jgi:hypothetical protein
MLFCTIWGVINMLTFFFMRLNDEINTALLPSWWSQKVSRDCMSQPHFEGSVRSPLTLPKMGLGSPLRLPNFQSVIAGAKTPCIEVFFIPLERSWSVDVQMASHEPFGHLKHKLWSKEGSGVKLAVWLPTTKSQESTQFRCVQVKCDTLLKSSRGELQLWFRPRLDPSSRRKIMNPQSPGSPNRDSFGTPLWESREKEPFGCKCSGEL